MMKKFGMIAVVGLLSLGAFAGDFSTEKVKLEKDLRSAIQVDQYERAMAISTTLNNLASMENSALLNKNLRKINMLFKASPIILNHLMERKEIADAIQHDSDTACGFEFVSIIADFLASDSPELYKLCQRCNDLVDTTFDAPKTEALKRRDRGNDKYGK